MAKLVDTTEWREFRVGDLFDVCRGTGYGLRDLVEGDTPLISAKTTDNSIVVRANVPAKFPPNTITVTTDGAGMGFATVQIESFDIASNAVALLPRESMCIAQSALLFICPLISQGAYRFDYGDKFNANRVRELILRLPATVDGKPDWDYMEQYMAHAMDEMRPVADELHQLESTLSLHAVDVSEWEEFMVGDLFEVKHPTRARSLKQYVDGDVAFVATGVGECGNGVSAYVQPLSDEQIDAGGCITVSPVDGKCFWQPNDFCGRGGAGSSILLCYPKDIQFDEHAGMFIAAVMTDVYSGWTYSDAGSGSIVKQSSIKLPATLDGKPDWDAMVEMMRGYTDSVREVAEVLGELR